MSKIVIYPGRFQPFHINHFQVYRELINNFGEDNVYIATTGKVDKDVSPLSFDEKVKVMTRMFGIRQDKIVKVKSPYKPSEIIDNYTQDKDVLIIVIGDKDSDRSKKLLSSRYYSLYKEDEVQDYDSYESQGYLYEFPLRDFRISGEVLNATKIRQLLSSSELSTKNKKRLFTNMYLKFDPGIFDLLMDRFYYDRLNIESTGIKNIMDLFRV